MLFAVLSGIAKLVRLVVRIVVKTLARSDALLDVAHTEPVHDRPSEIASPPLQHLDGNDRVVERNAPRPSAPAPDRVDSSDDALVLVCSAGFKNTGARTRHKFHAMSGSVCDADLCGGLAPAVR